MKNNSTCFTRLLWRLKEINCFWSIWNGAWHLPSNLFVSGNNPYSDYFGKASVSFSFFFAHSCLIGKSCLYSQTEKRPFRRLFFAALAQSGNLKISSVPSIRRGNCQLSIINIYCRLTEVVAVMRECQIHPQKVMLFQVKYRFDCNVFPLVSYFFISLEI